MAASVPRILIVTGLMAAGKSTIAQGLADRLSPSVHLRGDVFRKMIVNGRVEMSPDAPLEAARQLQLRYALAWRTCAAYAEAGFFVAYQDVLLGPQLGEAAARLAAWSPGVVVLTPRLTVVAERDAGRHKQVYGGAWTPEALGRGLEATPRLGLWLDTSEMTPDQTVEAILDRAEETRRGLA